MRKVTCIVGSAWRGGTGGSRAPRRAPDAGGREGQWHNSKVGRDEAAELLQLSRMKHNYGNSYDNYYNHLMSLMITFKLCTYSK